MLASTDPGGNWPERPSPHFHRDEFRCRGDQYREVEDRCGCRGSLPEWTERHRELFELLSMLRRRHGAPLPVISGYRCPNHKLEREKDVPGAHAQGLAADLGVGTAAAKLMLAREATLWADARMARAYAKMTGIGIGLGARHGVSKFHVDLAAGRSGIAFWTY